MVLVKASKDSEAGAMPSTQLLAEMGKFNEELVNAGIMLAGEGLHPSSKGVRIRFSGKNRTVIDGPFAETKELVAGYWIWQVKSMDEAIAWLKRCPNPMTEDSEVEIRRIFAPEDFGEAFTPELQGREAGMRAEMDRYQLDPPRYENGKGMLIAGLNDTYTFETRHNIQAQWGAFARAVATCLARSASALTACAGITSQVSASIISLESRSPVRTVCPRTSSTSALPLPATPYSRIADTSRCFRKPSTPSGKSGCPIRAMNQPVRPASNATPRNSTRKRTWAEQKFGCRSRLRAFGWLLTAPDCATVRPKGHAGRE